MISGFYNVIKPTGFTSSDAVVKLRGILSSAFHTKVKIGHFGTLDPGGSGVLVVAIGNATKLFDSFSAHTKTYRAQAVFGASTDTLDSYGKVVKKSDWYDNIDNLSNDFFDNLKSRINDIIPTFIGKQKQLPPDYSSKSIDGKRAYDLAREGKEVKLKEADIEIFEIKIVSIDKNRFTFDITCSSGTYIRSFVRDLGVALGLPAFMSYIIRLECAGFSIDDSVSINDIALDCTKGFISLEQYADRYPEFTLNSKQKKDFAVGNRIYSSELNGLCRVTCGCKKLGIGDFSAGFLKMVCSFEEYVVPLENFDKSLYKQKYSIGLGYFDTIHLGHASLLREVVKSNGISAVLTFITPLAGVIDTKTEKDLYTFNERCGLFEKIGIRKVFTAIPDNKFLSLSPTQFLDLLTSKINLGTLVVGKNYTFGYKAQGNVELLSNYCIKHDIKLIIIDDVTFDDIKVSSSYIKRMIADGKIDVATKLLNRRYSVYGKVLHGREDGRKIGFPTVNLKLDENRIAPKFGVYKGEIRIDGKYYKTLINVGTHPTFNDNSVNIEAYILDFDRNIYDYPVEIFFDKYIRDVIHFETVDALKKQIQRDLEEFNE